MSDPFANTARTLQDPGARHAILSADESADLDPMPRAIFCLEAGTITLRDETGADVAYALDAGMLLPFRPTRVVAISGGSFVGWS
ncbi:spike base protein, RCAP_Rcc01079 family [Frigidibacter oleivorans]|uniref:spike base protein, RCAP_Rcc01079 family n=1 Tax=Frigidibacter oleivorans TaxID=2487129 RepID=UPI000F8D5EA6|nr:hypothetical protein [Frigidibacter oleivorans]